MRAVLALSFCLLAPVAMAQPDPVAMARALGVRNLPTPARTLPPVQTIQDPARAALSQAQSLSVAPRGGTIQAPIVQTTSAISVPGGVRQVPSNESLPGLNRSSLGVPMVPDDLRALLPNGVGPDANAQAAPNPALAPLVLQPAPDAQLLATGDRGACVAYIAEAEQRFQIPRAMLRSIAYVESAYGGAPWPWTLNVGGKPVYARSAQEAAQIITTSSGSMRSDVAVGCMQLFTRWHAGRFRNALHMIDPRTNVLYAGWYLRSLYQQYGTWHEAVARYHSSNATYQREYLCRIVSVRMKLGAQAPNAWYARTCPGGQNAYVAWAAAQR